MLVKVVQFRQYYNLLLIVTVSILFYAVDGFDFVFDFFQPRGASTNLIVSKKTKILLGTDRSNCWHRFVNRLFIIEFTGWPERKK